MDQALVDDINALIELKPNWEVIHYTNYDKLWISYLRTTPDLVINDLDLTKMSSTEGSSKTRMGIIHPHFIFVSSTKLASPEGEFAAQLGAFDYLQKPVDLGRVVLAMAVAEGPTRD